MDAWSTVAGMRAMESINSIAQNVDKLGRNHPTLRDQFAMATLNGLLANSNFSFDTEDSLAKYCYKVADEMLAARQEN